MTTQQKTRGEKNIFGWLTKRRMATGAGGVLIPLSHRQIILDKEKSKMSKKLEIVRADYQGMEVSFTEDGWFNATEAAERFGKRVDNWMRLQETKDYFSAVIQHSNHSHVSDLINTKRGKNGGTWIHSDLIVSFGRWISPDFSVWCDQQIKNLLSGKHPHFDWRRVRHEATSSFKVMNDILKDVRAEIGKATQSYHYSNEARLINWALTGEFKGLDRDDLSVMELDFLARLEEKNTVLIGRGVEYQTRKKILEQYAIDLRPTPIALEA